MGFPRQEYWNGLQFPFLGDHPDLGIKPTFPTTAGGFFITEPPGSHEIKRCLLLGRKAIAKLDNMLQSRDTLPTKVCIVKTMVFPVVMYGCDSWTIKKVECQRTDAFELWCWRRFLRVPWTSRRSKLSILKDINPEYSLEGLMLKLQNLATWCSEPTWKRS